MKIVRRVTRGAHLLGAISAALILVGCADKQEVAAPVAKLKTASSEFMVSSEITLFDKMGKVRTFRTNQRLQATLRGGIARASIVSLPNSMTITDSSALAAGYTQPLTPVVAVSTGLAVGNYTQIVTDTTTWKNYRIVATGPMIYNYPIDVAYAYNSNGSKIGETHYRWTPVTGGYALLAQKEVSYSSTGAMTASAVSYVTAPATYAMAESPSISARLGSLLAGVSCYFAPPVAYAQSSEKGGSGVVVRPWTGVHPNNMPLPGSTCWGEGAILGVNTGTLAVETAFGVLEPIMIPVYLGTWTSWTHSLWDFLDCLNRSPRCTPTTCTGGGGTSW